MRKLLLLFAVMLSTVGAWAQVYQKVPHTKWTVTALNEAGQSGNEGGVAYLKDENSATFYHSNWSGGYSDGTTGKNKGQDGVQAFMVDMAEVVAFDRLTYTGRSDKDTNWATKVRVYIFDNLPPGWPKSGENYRALNTLTYAEKEDLLKKESNAVLGTPAFDNNETGTWAEDRNVKTIEFATPQTGKYILFVADATTGTNGYFTCSDFHVWQKVDGIVADKPYYLKINGLDGNYYLDTRVGERSDYGNTICKTQTPVATYFTLNDGYWHISSLPGNERNFIGITNWDAIPGKDTPTNWTLHEVEEGLWSLAQSTYYGGGEAQKHYLGANDGNISGNSKLYTDKAIDQAVKFELVELTEEQAIAEAARVTKDNLGYAKEVASAWLNRVGAGYPSFDSEARTALQNAINAEDATRESVEAALAEYQAYQTVVMPEVGKVYRLVSGYTAFSSKKALYSDNNELKWQNKNDAAMNQLWTVLSCANGNIVLMNVNDALYPQKTEWAHGVTMFSSENECSISFCGKGQFQVFANKQQRMFANGHASGNGASGNITNYNDGGVDSYSSWYFEEVAITKDILSKQIESLSTAYIGSLLVKQESVADLAAAVDVAQGVCDAEGDYANAFATLVASVNDATIDYIDLGYFYMKSKEGNKYAYNDGNNLKAADVKICKSVFKLTKANNGCFYMQNGNGYYAQNVAQSAQTVIGSSAVEYTISRLSTGYYVLRPKNATGSHQFWHQDGSNKIVGWETAAGNTQWTFEPLSEEEVEKIYTVNLATCDASHYLSYTGEYAGDKDVKANGGFYVLDAVPTETDLNVQNLGDYASSVNIDAIQRNIKVVTGVDNSSIYILRCLKDNTYARYHSECQLSANDKTNMMTWHSGVVMESLFYIEEGTDEYAGFYTIRSYAAPTMYAYNLGTDNANSKVAMKEAPAEGGLTSAYYWKITYRDENGRPANITPYHEGGNTGDNYGWNKRGAYEGKNHIGYWNDDASCNATSDNKWYVRTVEEELTALGKLPLPQYTSDNSVIGLTTYESVEPVIGFEKLINQTGLNAINNVSYKVVGPKVGSFIRLKNEKSSKYMYGNKTTIKITDDAKANELPSTIFYLDKSNTLLSYVDGRYLDCEVKGYSAVGTANAGEFNFAYGGAKENVVVYKNHGVYTFGGATSGVGPDNIDKGSGYNENGYNWIVEGVASLPVTITSAGYATFYSPVAVTLPAEGLKAYYVSSVEDASAKMTEIVDGVIPANTGVILEGNEGAYDLTIDGEAVAVEDNKLSGTAAATYITEDAYVLSMVNEEVGFNKAAKNQQSNSSWLNNAFKAYLPANAVTTANARFLVFDFGGTETAIEGIEAESTANAVVYDLAGRRVQNAQKGVFIVNGKVVVK